MTDIERFNPLWVKEARRGAEAFQKHYAGRESPRHWKGDSFQNQFAGNLAEQCVKDRLIFLDLEPWCNFGTGYPKPEWSEDLGDHQVCGRWIEVKAIPFGANKSWALCKQSEYKSGAWVYWWVKVWDEREFQHAGWCWGKDVPKLGEAPGYIATMGRAYGRRMHRLPYQMSELYAILDQMRIGAEDRAPVAT